MPQKNKEMVHVLTNKVQMRFAPSHEQPKLDLNCPNSSNSLLKKILQTFAPQSIIKSQILKSHTKMEDSILSNKKQKQESVEHERITFALMLSGEHFMIGNSQQLDVVHLTKNCNNYVEADYLWSIRKKNKITHVCLEEKKINLLVIVSQKVVDLYHYDHKKIPSQPFSAFKEILLQDEPKFVRIVRESNICLFFETHLEIFSCLGNVRRIFKNSYDMPQSPTSSFSLFYVPQSYENYINIFFQENLKDNKCIFVLWCVELEFTNDVRAGRMEKVYEIKDSFRKSIKLVNYSREIFLLNLGIEVLALKRGYVLDSASSNVGNSSSSLQFLGNDSLLHICDKKMDVYSLSIETRKFTIKSKDSIRIHNLNPSEEFFKSFNVFTNQLMIMFQTKKGAGKTKQGEVRYSLYITCQLTKQAKMLQLFPRQESKFNTEDPIFLEKCDIAEKMGYSKKEIYYELWNRSGKNSEEDYALLLGTCDYKTITEEIIRKLKKNSMNFTEIQSVERSSFEMLKTEVFGKKCTFEAVSNYLNCHLFNRKLQMFRSMKTMQKLKLQVSQEMEGQKVPRMNIREYQFYRGMQLKNQLICYITQFCHQNSEHRNQIPNNIKFLLSSFKFAFKAVYEEILLDIIKAANHNLSKLLIEVPEILPYHPPKQVNRPIYIPNDFESGVWAPMTAQDWETNIYNDTLITIDNRQVVAQVCKNIEFKRNWLYQHDMIAKWKTEIVKCEKKLKSPYIFYYFIAKLFQQISDRDILQQIINFMQFKYSAPNQQNLTQGSTVNSNKASTPPRMEDQGIPYFPGNIKGKVFLMQQIYLFFESKNIIPIRDGKPYSFTQFLYLQDPQLIKHCFEKERSMKGLLLKNIKEIYAKNSDNAQQLFNNALLNYFISDLSEISDLKYLLNRINSQNQKFHRQNISLYAVLVEALLRKMKIGTGNDIPLDEVLIYLENIPLMMAHNSEQSEQQIPINPINLQILNQLKSVYGIRQEALFLQNSKINMTIYNILRNPEQVFTKIISFSINQASPKVWRSLDTFIPFAIKKIVEVEEFALQVYHSEDQQQDFKRIIFFIFLSKLCEQVTRIQFAKGMLQNKQIGDRYDNFTACSLVQYLYKWKMSKQNSFLQNQQYLLQLLTFLPQHNNTYKYIYNQLQFAKILSDGNDSTQIKYPISHTYLHIDDIRRIISDLSIQFVIQIDIQRLYQVVANIQGILVDDQNFLQAVDQHDKFDVLVDPKSQTTIRQLYQVFILKYISSGKLKQVITLIKILIDLPKNEEVADYDYTIVFVLLYLIEISKQLNLQNQQNLIQCCWFYFDRPKQLMSKLEFIVTTPLSTQNKKKQIMKFLDAGQLRSYGYNSKNDIISEDYLAYASRNQNNQHKFGNILRNFAQHIQNSKEDFHTIKYSIILIILFNEPYALSKFIQCNSQAYVRPIRSILSYAVLEDVFVAEKLLQLGKRVFMILFQANSTKIPIQHIIPNYTAVSIEEDMWAADQQEFKNAQFDDLEDLLWKSALAFRKKKQYIMGSHMGKSLIFNKKKLTQSEQAQKINNLFQSIDGQQQSKEPSQYIFDDSDNEDRLDLDLKQKNARKIADYAESQSVPNYENDTVYSWIELQKQFALFKPANKKQKKKKNPLFISRTNSIKEDRICSSMSSSKERNSEMICLSSSLIPGKNPINIRSSNQSIHSQDNERMTKSKDEFIKIEDLPLEKPKSAQLSPSSDRFGHSFGQQENNNKRPSKIPIMRMEQEDDLLSNEYEIYSPIISDPDNEGSIQFSEYIIRLFEVQQLDDIDQQQMNKEQDHEKTQQKLQLQQQLSSSLEEQQEITKEQIICILADHCLVINQNSCEGEYDLTSLENFSNNPTAILAVLHELYQRCMDKFDQNILKLMQEIVVELRPQGIHIDEFKIVCRVWEAQSRIIPDIQFNQLLPQQSFFKAYNSSRQIFDELYKNLKAYIGSQNIYTVSQFMRRAFDNSQYQQTVAWGFIMDLCNKVETTASEQREWTLQKIAATLPRIETRIWLQQFQSMKRVIEGENRNSILSIFCNILKARNHDKDGIAFLKAVLDLYKDKQLSQTLNVIEKL